MRKPLIIKKSPVVIVKSFILLQGGAIAAFFIASALADYGEIYDLIPVANLISFKIAEAIFLFLAETALIFYIFFRWYRESFHIKGEEIVHAKGILYRRRTTIPLDNVVSVSYRQTPLGKLTNYGIIELISNNSDQKVKLTNVPSPEENVGLILKQKRLSTNKKNEITLTGAPSNIVELLNKGEHENLEFKSTFRWDTRQNAVNRTLEKSVMKTIAAFLNSQGGQLVIGVDDNKNIVGLDPDYGSLNKKDADGFENHFTHVFHNMIGAEFRQFVKLNWSQANGKECCIVSVAPGSKPAYLKNDSNGEEFFIRTGNGTTSLKLSEAKTYIDSRWGMF